MGRAAGGRNECSCVHYSRDAAPRQQAPRRAAIQVAGDSGAHARETGIVRVLAAGGLFRCPSTESGLRHSRTAGIARRACRSTRLAGRPGQRRSGSHLSHAAGVNVLSRRHEPARLRGRESNQRLDARLGPRGGPPLDERGDDHEERDRRRLDVLTRGHRTDHGQGYQRVHPGLALRLSFGAASAGGSDSIVAMRGAETGRGSVAEGASSIASRKQGLTGGSDQKAAAARGRPQRGNKLSA